MKKIRNLVIGGLQQKIFNLVLFSIVLVVLAFLAVAMYQTNSLTKLFQKANEDQKTAITESTSAIMEGVTNQVMARDTDMEAYIADSIFKKVGGEVRTLADLTQNLYSNSGDYKEMSAARPDPDKNGTVTVQLLNAEGVDINSPEIAHEIGLLSNLSVAMCSIYATIDQANSCFVATPSGVMLFVDDNPAGKYDDNGKLIDVPVTERPWYIGASESGGLYFTGLEEDIFTGKVGLVCSYPVYHEGELVAVVGADLFLDAMAEAVEESGSRDGFVCVVDHLGRVVFSPEREGVFAASLASSATDIRNNENKDLAELVKEAMTVSTGVHLVDIDGVRYYISGAPIGTVGWALLSVIDYETIHGPVDDIVDRHNEIIKSTQISVENSSEHSQLTILVLLFVVMTLALAGSLTLARRIVQPLNIMTKSVAEINDTNQLFLMKDEYRTDDEIQVLAESFADLSSKTQTYIEHITEITAEKERIGTELELATRIQADMLPNIFPPFPGRKDIDIFASMNPAKEVGGDFYDFFLIDDDHLAMVMADVSGKGVPAALFMMMSKILVSNNTMLCDSPNEVLERVNNQICKNNEEDMFVTVWLGILTISTGHIIASNAGHEYPILKKPGGRFEVMKDRHSFVIGGMSGVRYKKYEFDLERGGALFLYTDGVPEATNIDNELFGVPRMLEVLNREPDADAGRLLGNMYSTVCDFVGDAPQFDDITMMAIKLR